MLTYPLQVKYDDGSLVIVWGDSRWIVPGTWTEQTEDDE